VPEPVLDDRFGPQAAEVAPLEGFRCLLVGFRRLVARSSWWRKRPWSSAPSTCVLRELAVCESYCTKTGATDASCKLFGIVNGDGQTERTTFVVRRCTVLRTTTYE
jgi:hypothetical protein